MTCKNWYLFPFKDFQFHFLFYICPLAKMNNDTILIIGASGQIGSELTMALRKIYSNVVATDLKDPSEEVKQSGKFERLDVLSKNHLIDCIKRNEVKQIYHLAAVLS